MEIIKNNVWNFRSFLILIFFLFGILNGLKSFAALPQPKVKLPTCPNMSEGQYCDPKAFTLCLKVSTSCLMQTCKCDNSHPDPNIAGPATGRWTCSACGRKY
jgi:hypothetical protein